jgi:hypothetical protein
MMHLKVPMDIKKFSLNFEALKGGGRVKDGRSILHE